MTHHIGAITALAPKDKLHSRLGAGSRCLGALRPAPACQQASLVPITKDPGISWGDCDIPGEGPHLVPGRTP